ncbi:hypothetical protein LB545_07530 [Mesorhizobium sp. BR1-1-6]|uniref:hypothetical protein n=1 Tax=Mesorhizobium sp. BR1-1-6 TaxID=2876648 RepID=UPI001CD0DAFD|nr:hypothetical protein [Mesorhizobium sp. BR1-1-6]MBZ9894193.1 hypothetical protein [Mesorhizobium sp. BR1-1-6]
MNPGEDMQAQPPPASDDKIAADRDRWRKDAERLEQQVSSQAAEIERLKAALEAALSASPVGQIAEGETREDIARILFQQRQPPFSWDDNPDEPESDAGTLRSICLDDADAVLAALSAAPAPPATGWQGISTAPHACHVLATRFDRDCGEWVYGIVLSPPIYSFTHWKHLPSAPGAES